jgi:hypothetical protein
MSACTDATVRGMPMRRLPVLAAAFGLTLGAAACGAGERDSSPPRAASDAQPASVSSGCPPAPGDLAAVLRRGVRHAGRLRRLFAVRSMASFSGKDSEVQSGAYFVSGNIGAAVFTWAVNSQALRTGAGLILAADRETRAVSPRRWIVHPGVLEERYGISEHTDGYIRARRCANATRG